MLKELYTARVTVTGGRDGRAVADDGKLDVAMAMPKEIGGSGAGTNPEQLFAAGFAGCFTSSLRYTAGQMKLDPGEVSVDSAVALTLSPEGTYGLHVTLMPSLPGLSPADRTRVIEGAERICAYTNATRGHVALTIIPKVTA